MSEPKPDAMNELGGTNAYWLKVESSRIAMADELTRAGIPVGIEQAERVRMLVEERDAYRAMLADVVASAHPNERDHQAMSKQWKRAIATLKTGKRQP